MGMLRMTSAQVSPGSQKGQQAETELQERSETLPRPQHTHTIAKPKSSAGRWGHSKPQSSYPTDRTQLGEASQISWLFLPAGMLSSSFSS